ncbi:MAG: class I SAM-dependent methyltransferase [Candidatus Doudnabacteria bacterium]
MRSHALSAHLPGPFASLLGLVLRGIRVGTLSVTAPGGRVYRFGGRAPGPAAAITVRDPGLARKIIAGGDIALAEGYMDGSWDTDDLAAVLHLALANISAGWTADVPFVLRPAHRLWHAMRDNDPAGGSRRNIEAHYDLGNDFYELWLDEGMTYSSAILGDGSARPTLDELEDGQRRKYDRILEMIQPGSRDHILEIGCGWGGFALHAAREAGCKVTGLTLSAEQAELARARVRDEGLDGMVDIRLQDYREVPGAYSAIASIEMFEAVGERWWPVFFRRIGELLERGRAAALQVITIEDSRYDDYKHNPDFIQRYVFPGGMLPSVERFVAAAAASGLEVGEPHMFGEDYAKTLGVWLDRFEAAQPRVRALGFDERFIRMWRYYLVYCRTGFEQGSIDVMQIRLST